MQPPDMHVEDPNAALERLFIEDYLRARGHTAESLHTLPASEAAVLLVAATLDASLRLADVESKAHYVHEIHHST